MADADKASVFIEDPGQRLLFKEWLERQSDKRRYEETTVIQAVLGDERDKTVNGRTREAGVRACARLRASAADPSDLEVQTDVAPRPGGLSSGKTPRAVWMRTNPRQVRVAKKTP